MGQSEKVLVLNKKVGESRVPRRKREPEYSMVKVEPVEQ